MAVRRHRLSKSKIAAFEHCPRRLWLQAHRREAAIFDPATLKRFEFGHEVGKRARMALPHGILVEEDFDMPAALERTAALIALGPIQPIFEATFQHENVLVRVDILEPDGEGGWQAIEVKASLRVKPYQLADVATQVWVMRSSGVNVGRVSLRHLAPPFSWSNPQIAAVRFVDTDVTHAIDRYLATRSSVAARAQTAIDGPEIWRAPGTHCFKPFDCEFRMHCLRVQATPLLATVI